MTSIAEMIMDIPTKARPQYTLQVLSLIAPIT
jgi:hypothetical protein